VEQLLRIAVGLRVASRSRVVLSRSPLKPWLSSLPSRRAALRVFAVVRAKSLTESQRMIGVDGIVVVIALLAMWVIFVWPAYWD